MHSQKSRRSSSSRELAVDAAVLHKPDFVRVDGRYRVGRLLGSGGSGAPDSLLELTYLSDFYRECLSGKRYQDRSRCCSEDRASELLSFKACT
jgi:hypothetical protein